MFIPDPDFCSSQIPDLKTATKERVKKIYCPTFFVTTNITKLKIILFLTDKEKIWTSLQRITELIT